VFKKERDVGDKKFQNWCEIHYFSIIERGNFPVFMNIYEPVWLISAELSVIIYVSISPATSMADEWLTCFLLIQEVSGSYLNQ
jgi:hypothetical protein